MKIFVMKKERVMRKTMLFTAAAVMALALAAAGCGKVEETNSMLTREIVDEKECTIELETADEGTSTSSAALVIEEGEELVIEPGLEEGSKVLIQMKSGAENENADTLPDMSNPEFEVTVEGNDILQCSLEAGSYRVNVLPQEKSSGTIVMKVQAAGAAETEADAAAGGHAWVLLLISTELRSPWESSERWAASHTAIWTASRRFSALRQRLR